MGCDIHLYAEIQNEDGEWEIAAPEEFDMKWRRENSIDQNPFIIEFNSYGKPREEGGLFVWTEEDIAETYKERERRKVSFIKKRDWDGYEEVESENPEISLMDWDVGRYYRLFSKLAGVRSYGEDDRIDDPRGVPEDCSEEYRLLVEKWDCDGHSHTYMDPDEILGNLDAENFPSMYKHAKELKRRAGKGKGRFVFFFDN